MTVLVLAVFAGAYVLIATDRINKAAAALGGAAAMVLLGSSMPMSLSSAGRLRVD